MLKFLRHLNLPVSTDEVRADLNFLLISLNPQLPFEERMSALKGLMDWIRLPVSSIHSGGLIEGFGARNLRLKFLLQVLDRHEDLARYFLSTFQEVTGKSRAVRLYCLTGIPENTGFIGELMDRIVQKLLPAIHREKDLAELFKLIFSEKEDAEWFESNPDEIIVPFLSLLKKHQLDPRDLKEDQASALIILGSQVSALGISKHIRRFLSYQHISETSFFRLSMAINRAEMDDIILKEISNCRDSLKEVRLGIERSGVSVDLIHHLEKIDALIDRIEMILYLRYPAREAPQTPAISRFIGRLIRDEIRSHGVKDYIRQNLHMLTRKIVERAGDKGDTYIAHNQKERAHLFFAASWAGVLTAFTAVIKYWIGLASLPLFIEGLFFFINYAVSFLLMQKWHLALSSKQPAYTASALSKRFEHFLKTKELSPIIIEIKKVMRSQFIAAWANLLWVVPVTALLDTLWFWGTNSSILSPHMAMEAINKHHLWNGLTLFYAAFTGVLLWFSSVVAGWTENWIVFRGIPTLLMENTFLKRVIGAPRLEYLAEKCPSAMAGVSGNLSIAFFLATPIIIGKLTGLPLDIRHVTLAAGTITLGLGGLGWGLEHWPLYLEMIVTVLIIGFLNFGVSFYFAIRMAAIARDVDSKYLRIIFRFSFRRQKSLKFSE